MTSIEHPHLRQLLHAFSERKPLRAGSLMMTVFGDSVAQHGNNVWLGSMISALQPFGVNARQIRTSIFRLAQDGWVEALQLGRKSYYSLTGFGLRHYAKAARRIYAASAPEWDGEWTLVIPAFIFDEERDALRKELLWLGFGTISPGIMAHPGADRQSLDETLQELGAAEKVVVMTSHTGDPLSASALRELAYSCWKLDELKARYCQLVTDLRPLATFYADGGELSSYDAFCLRTYVVHEYRRILLKDTDLPEELLPADWPGREARELVAGLYKDCEHAAEQYLLSAFETASGEMPGAAGDYFTRFGGLRKR